MSYRIEDIKKSLEYYVLNCESEYNLNDKIDVHGELRTFKWLLDELVSCKHPLPGGLCEYLELESGMTYADAVQNIRNNLKTT